MTFPVGHRVMSDHLQYFSVVLAGRVWHPRVNTESSQPMAAINCARKANAVRGPFTVSFERLLQ
jgi:hypothetical protein